MAGIGGFLAAQVIFSFSENGGFGFVFGHL